MNAQQTIIEAIETGDKSKFDPDNLSASYARLYNSFNSTPSSIESTRNSLLSAMVTIEVRQFRSKAPYTIKRGQRHS